VFDFRIVFFRIHVSNTVNLTSTIISKEIPVTSSRSSEGEDEFQYDGIEKAHRYKDVWNTTDFSLRMRTRTISNPEDGPTKALLDWVTSEQSAKWHLDIQRL
jgi:hypothetical protein